MHNHSHHSPLSYEQAGPYMRRAAMASLVIGMILVAIKAAAWLMSDSLSMMSSLADSILDVMASAINFVAIRYSLQPPDEEHRFGHGKAEDLATLAQSTFICGSGGFLIIEGLKRLLFPEPVHNSSVGIAVMVVSIVFTLSLVTYQRYVVRKTSSSAVAADAMHYFADFIANIGVIIAFVLTTSLGWKLADPMIALCIAAYIIHGAFHMGLDAFHKLMDREFSDMEREEIKRIVKNFPEISGMHELRTRKSGLNGFIQFHLVFQDREISLKKAHRISDNIENALKEVFPNMDILIHQDPYNDAGSV